MGVIASMMGNAGTVNPGELQNEYGLLLGDDESFEIGFRIFRDLFIFTTKRIILIDHQGLTGKKTEYTSIPYRAITRYAVETAGHFDLDAELKLWMRGSLQPTISKTFNKKGQCLRPAAGSGNPYLTQRGVPVSV